MNRETSPARSFPFATTRSISSTSRGRSRPFIAPMAGHLTSLQLNSKERSRPRLRRWNARKTYSIGTRSDFVIAGLVPATHVFTTSRQKGVDARYRVGHDE